MALSLKGPNASNGINISENVAFRMIGTLRASVTGVIERDIDEVFEYVADLLTMDDWVADVSNTRLISGEAARTGAVYEFEMAHRGEMVTMQVEIAAEDPPRRIVMRSLEGPFSYESELTLSSEGSVRTRVTSAIEPGADDRFTAVAFTVFRPLVRWAMKRRLRAELDELTAILESAPAEQTPSA